MEETRLAHAFAGDVLAFAETSLRVAAQVCGYFDYELH